jgi:hypothetical protein
MNCGSFASQISTKQMVVLLNEHKAYRKEKPIL